LAKEKGINCEVRDISRDELYIADEVFLTGTAAEVKPVGEIDSRLVGDDGKVGRMTKELKSMFETVVHGKDKKFSKMWLVPVN
jgi:branched-chain amino acid aminotransferase